MSFRHGLLVAGLAVLAGCAAEKPRKEIVSPGPVPNAQPSAPSMKYPSARTVDVVDDFFGTKVADPYRWMESLDAPDVRSWIEAENALTQNYLSDTPRERIKARLTALYSYERYTVPEISGARLFYSRNDGLQNQAPWYWQDGANGKATAFIDPNTLSADGTTALSESAASNDGRRFAYSLSDGGSDWRTIKVRDVEQGRDLADEIHWAKFTNIAWAHDDSGFYYSRFDEPKGEDQLKAVNKFQKLYFHRIGTAQDKDQLVFERADQPDWGMGATVSDDGRYLVISISKGTDERNLVFYKDLSRADSKVLELVSEWKAAYNFIGNDGAQLYFHTDDGAERYRVVGASLAAKPQWREIVAQSEATLTGVTMIRGQLIASYLHDAHSELKAFDFAGKLLHDIALPGLGTVGDVHGGSRDEQAFFSFESFTVPASVYRYDARLGAATAFKTPTTSFDSSQFETRQVFYPSKDGTRIPLFITSRKGVALDGGNPTILYGYGGFNISQTPSYKGATAAWLEMGGIYAVANLRGGGEYGRSWHEAGMKTHKQNVFDDFAAAAEYLIAQKYTRPDKLAISGRSNGGLLVGATMLQRPELFGAALPAVGVQEMLRFREFTIGWAWESDYGTVKKEDEFKAIYAYSPYHNVKPNVNYPPTLITTADHDDRVFPAHSFKFAARLQANYTGSNPMLIRVETRAGHGAGKSTTKLIEENTDIYGFLVKTLKMRVD